MNDKYEVFLEISKYLNSKFNAIPLLFGSLGLEKRIERDMEADDIDILVPEIYLNSKWDDLRSIMDELGFILQDLHEHEFLRNNVKAAFAALESLTPFAGIKLDEIPIIEDKDCKYKLLSLEDYLKVYQASSKDSYRVNQKNKKDYQKIAIIKEKLRFI